MDLHIGQVDYRVTGGWRNCSNETCLLNWEDKNAQHTEKTNLNLSPSETIPNEIFKNQSFLKTFSYSWIFNKQDN